MDTVIMAYRVCLVFAALVAVASVASAGTYYIATTGSDGNPGTFKRPFQTVQKAADMAKPGDVCMVRGGVYREAVRPANSGLPEAPIVFKAYKKERVVISGADPITGWKRAEGGVWRAQADRVFEQLFVDGRMMNPACWPNSPLDPMKQVWAVAAAGSGPNTIVDPSLPSVDLAGAVMHVLPGEHWVSWVRPILEYNPDSHTLKFEGDWSQDHAHAVREGTRYILRGARALLDTAGEWHFDVSMGAVYLLPPVNDDVSTLHVEAKRRDLAFDLSNRQHIRLEGFLIFAGTINLSDASDCLIANCHIRYASHFTNCEGWSSHNNSGIVVSGHGNIVRDSSVVYSAGNGITLLGKGNTVTNCLVQNADYAATDCAAVWAEGKGNIISHNTLCDAGRSVVVHRTLKNGRIEYNDMFNAGLITTDLGITYCFNTDGAGTVIAHNWVHHNRAARCGVGIYIDNGSSNFIIHHNVSWSNPDSGIRLNTPSHNNSVYCNTVLDNGNSVNYWGPEDNKDQAGCRLINNVCNNEVRTGAGIETDHNYTGASPGVVSITKRDFRLRKDSPCIDAGLPVAGITDGFKGKAPDLGACESGARPWKAGHNWGEPPAF